MNAERMKYFLEAKLKEGQKLGVKNPNDYYSGIAFGMGLILGLADKSNIHFILLQEVHDTTLEVMTEMAKT